MLTASSTIRSIQSGAAELARRIASGELSSAEVVDQHIARIEEVNPSLNAVIVPFFERARAEATEADRKRKRGDKLGALHGVPITLKEQLEVEGAPSTWGLPSRAGQIAIADGPLVRRRRGAGAIVLGVTNVPQLRWREDIVLAVMKAAERRLREQPDYPAGALGRGPLPA